MNGLKVSLFRNVSKSSLAVLLLALVVAVPGFASDLDVNTNSSFTGTYGLEVDLSSGGSAYVQDDTPAAESRYRVRFYVDPSSLAGCGSDCSVSVFEAFSSNGGKTFDVRLRKQPSGFFLQFQIVSASGTFNPKWAINETGWTAVEVDWQAASSTSSSDGGIDFWINGTARSGYSNLGWSADNDIDSVRLGNPGVNTFGAGTVDIDDFESRRDSFIGIITDQPLAAPALVTPTGSITDTTPTLRWNAVPGATSYQVYVYNLNTSTFIASPTVTGTTYTTVGLNQNHDYRWRVRTQSDGGFGPTSSWNNFTYGASSPPPIPGTIAPLGSITDSTPTFAWNASNGADRYQIYLQDLTSGSYIDTTSSITSTSYTSAVLDTNHAYRWRLRAYNSAGWSGLSNWKNFDYVSGPPPTPSQLAPFGTLTQNPPTFTWTLAATANRYQIYIQNITLSTFIDTTSTIPGTSYTPAAIDPDYSYRWRIRAYNSAGWSNVGGWSNFDFFVNPPATPTPLMPNSSTSSPPTYTWNAVPQATRYQIYVQDLSDSSFVETPSLLTGTSYNGVALSSGSYRWRIRAYNPAGWSSTSSWVNFSVP